ncbi:MAG: phosphomannomutase/phosphoglucomutase [Candidatus Diapherotrites archaeon]|nr:phosphomannomutase/phosphoglucomutase [Candidatus Diapherotrites archaeon]
MIVLMLFLFLLFSFFFMVKVDSEIFREYDIRGLAETQISDETAELIGKAFGTTVIRANLKQCCVGYDNRISSPRIKKALIKGILSTGCNVIDVGLVPTPALYYSIIHFNAGMGVNVTASHNPREFNGFKLSKGFLAFFGQEIQNLFNLINSNDFEKGIGKIEVKPILNEYLNELIKRFNFKNSNLRICFDCGNGTSSIIVKEAFNLLNLKNSDFLFCESDGSFPNHLADPTVPELMQDLKEKVLNEKFDFGIGFDGDMDRIGVINSKGELIFGDKLLALYSRDLLSRNKKAKIVFDVKCSQALIDDIAEHNGIPLMNKTGHSLIKKRMNEENALLGGEMSGHMFFKENWFGFDDALYSACKLIEIVLNSDNSLDNLLNSIPEFVSSPEIRLTCSDAEKFKVVEAIKNDFIKSNECITLDGVRVVFEDGWGLVRVSNTQPKIILRFEAKTEKRLEEIKELFYSKLKKFASVELN